MEGVRDGIVVKESVHTCRGRDLQYNPDADECEEMRTE